METFLKEFAENLNKTKVFVIKYNGEIVKLKSGKIAWTSKGNARLALINQFDSRYQDYKNKKIGILLRNKVKWYDIPDKLMINREYIKKLRDDFISQFKIEEII